MTPAGGKLGTVECIMLLIGAMVGSAIFSLSGLTILTGGPAAVLSWILAGVIMLLYGMCMCELSCRYPKSGGVYYFPRMAFSGRTGQWLGWFSCWSCILTNIVAIAFSGIYVGIYLSVAFPWAAGMQLPLAAGSILFCLVLNLIRVDLAGKINTGIVLFLLLTMLLYISSAFFGGSFEPAMLTPFFHQGTGGTFGFLKAIPVAIIGYSGITALAFMVSDVRDARKNVPFSMLISILFVAGLYALMILSSLGLVSSEYLQKHPDMQFIPMFCACFTKLSQVPWLTGVVSISAVLALVTTMNVCVSINARAIQAAGRDGSLPFFFARSSRRGVPARAAGITCAFAMLYACFPEYTGQIVNFGAIFNLVTMVLTMLALIRVRSREGTVSFTVPGGKCVPLLVMGVLFVCNLIGIFRDSRLWLYTVAFLLLGAGIKWSTGRRR